MSFTSSPRGEFDSQPGAVHLLHYAFNQDGSCFVAGTTAGFRVYTTWPVCEARRREQSTGFQHGAVALATMLFKTNLFAMVTMPEGDQATGGPCKVQVWNDQTGKFPGELRSPNEVRGVAMRKDIIAMVCEYAVYVYTLDKLRVIQVLRTVANNRGLCVLAPTSEPWILCCPGQSVGTVRVQHGQDDRATRVFEAHQTPVAALATNACGSMVATASEKGTVVKVFQTSDGQLLYRLRRSARPASISSLCFAHDDRFLGVASSSSSTVHVFKLDRATALGPEDTAPGESGSFTASPRPAGQSFASESSTTSAGAGPAIGQLASSIQKAVRGIASHSTAEAVVAQVGDVVKGVMPAYFNDLRSFAQFRLPDTGSDGAPSVDTRSSRSSITGPLLAFHRSEPSLAVLHYSGILYECSFRPDHDPVHGTQDCKFCGATTWFAVRPDFRVQGLTAQCQTVTVGEGEGGDADEWQLLS